MLKMTAFRMLCGRGDAPMASTQNWYPAFHSGAVLGHWNSLRMLSSCWLHSLHMWLGALGSRLRTNVARWTNFLQCLSSVGSENGVPKEANSIFMVWSVMPPTLICQFFTQLGIAPATTVVVRWSVIFLWLGLIACVSPRSLSWAVVLS